MKKFISVMLVAAMAVTALTVNADILFLLELFMYQYSVNIAAA